MATKTPPLTHEEAQAKAQGLAEEGEATIGVYIKGLRYYAVFHDKNHKVVRSNVELGLVKRDRQ